MQQDMQIKARPGSLAEFSMGHVEFVTILAALMALNALSIDLMLPALPEIGKALRIADENSRQWIVSTYFLGVGIGALFYGSLADRFGRKSVLVISLLLFLVTALFCALATSFAMMIAGRFAAGLFAASTRVIAISIVRDRFAGDQMASIMSTVFIVFMIVPVLAPACGQAILLVASWRWIFGALLVLGSAITLWVALRLPETLAPENRIGIRLADISATFGQIVTCRSSLGYMMATGIVMGAMVGFITSIQQVFFDVFHEEEIFPLAFAGVAGSMAIGSFANSRLVERFGARRMSQGMLIAFILISVLHAAIVLAGRETIWTFCILQAMAMLCFAFVGSNFGSISMEPFVRGAGAASSFQACLTTILAGLIGAFIGSRFDGTTLPLVSGFIACGAAGLLLVSWAEEGKLFTRPRLPKMPGPYR